MKILNFGSCNIDYVYSVKHFLNPGETLSADSLDIFPGGKGLNQSVAVARAGAYVYHAGCIGEDGGFLRELLGNAGVDTRYIKTVEGKTGHAIIEVTPDGENRIMIFPGANARITEEFADSVLADFGKNDILILQNEISCRQYIMKKAREIGMTVVFNAAPFDEKIAAEDLSSVNYLAVNKTEASGLSGKSEISDIIPDIKSKYPEIRLILTLGTNGCRYVDGNVDLRQNAFEVTAVDTTAAGDTFIGYFVSGLANDMCMKEILKVSCAASALSVTKLGASSAVPTVSEVTKVIGTLKEKVQSEG